MHVSSFPAASNTFRTGPGPSSSARSRSNALVSSSTSSQHAQHVQEHVSYRNLLRSRPRLSCREYSHVGWDSVRFGTGGVFSDVPNRRLWGGEGGRLGRFSDGPTRGTEERCRSVREPGNGGIRPRTRRRPMDVLETNRRCSMDDEARVWRLRSPSETRTPTTDDREGWKRRVDGRWTRRTNDAAGTTRPSFDRCRRRADPFARRYVPTFLPSFPRALVALPPPRQVTLLRLPPTFPSASTVASVRHRVLGTWFASNELVWFTPRSPSPSPHVPRVNLEFTRLGGDPRTGEGEGERGARWRQPGHTNWHRQTRGGAAWQVRGRVRGAPSDVRRSKRPHVNPKGCREGWRRGPASRGPRQMSSPCTIEKPREEIDRSSRRKTSTRANATGCWTSANPRTKTANPAQAEAHNPPP